jgi:polysaccharide deacetylase 2 family uncharacterized protein YibQ
MTDEKRTMHDDPETDTAVAGDTAQGKVAQPKTFHAYGWMLWTALFCIALLGLAIAGLSTSEQIGKDIKVIPSVPREVAVPLPDHEAVKDMLSKPQAGATTDNTEHDIDKDTAETVSETTPETVVNHTEQQIAEENKVDQTPTAPTVTESPVVDDVQKPATPETVPEKTPETAPVFVPDDAPPQTETPLTIDPQSKWNYTPLPVASETKTAAVIPASVPAEKKTPIQPSNAQFKNPVIAIVIDDMGLDRRHTAQIVALAAPITVAYMPYAEQLDQQTAQAWRAGHELMVHMPMEPGNLAQNNPGPDALLLKNAADENMRRLRKNLNAFNGYMGINNHMGSAFTVNRAAVTPILQELKKQGVWFLDSKTDARSVAATVAGEIGLPYAARDVFLDNVNSKAYVLQQLHQTERVARQKGFAIAIGHPRSGTVQALAEWLPQLAQRNLTVVPLSSIIHARFPQAPLPRFARARDFKTSQATVSASAKH